MHAQKSIQFITTLKILGFFFKKEGIYLRTSDNDMECNINLSYIREIVGEDPDMLKEFIADIVNQLEEADLLIQQHIQKRDLDGLAKTAHRLKSSLQIIGATPLASKLNELESLATNAQLSQEIISLHKVIEVLSETCKAKLKSKL